MLIEFRIQLRRCAILDLIIADVIASRTLYYNGIPIVFVSCAELQLFKTHNDS